MNVDALSLCNFGVELMSHLCDTTISQALNTKKNDEICKSRNHRKIERIQHHTRNSTYSVTVNTIANRKMNHNYIDSKEGERGAV